MSSPSAYEEYAAKVKAKKRKYYEENRETILANQRRRYRENKQYYKDYRKRKREEQKAYMKARYDERKALLKECKSQAGCQVCGIDEPAVLTFHHVYPEEKALNIAQMGTASEDALMDELEKCVVLCMNDHFLIEYA